MASVGLWLWADVPGWGCGTGPWYWIRKFDICQFNKIIIITTILIPNSSPPTLHLILVAHKEYQVSPSAHHILIQNSNDEDGATVKCANFPMTWILWFSRELHLLQVQECKINQPVCTSHPSSEEKWSDYCYPQRYLFHACAADVVIDSGSEWIHGNSEGALLSHVHHCVWVAITMQQGIGEPHSHQHQVHEYISRGD